MAKQKAIIVADLGFGDAGKGSIVDALVRREGARLVVRYNGGSQAAHNVVTEEGRQHIFSQFGSGTLFEGTRTHLSNFMLINPKSMIREDEHLRDIGVNDAFSRLTIDENAVVITPFHAAVNHIREVTRGETGRHGSCGKGVGEAAKDAILSPDVLTLRARDFRRDLTCLRNRLLDIQGIKFAQVARLLREASFHHRELLLDEVKILTSSNMDCLLSDYANFMQKIGNGIVSEGYSNSLLNQDGVIIFEGAQGVLLDQGAGFYPYITRSNTTFENAFELLVKSGFNGTVKKVGVIRAYATRHGPGPFPTEDSEISKVFDGDEINQHNIWQGHLRTGWLDILMLKYAIGSCRGGIDCLAINHLDQFRKLPEGAKFAFEYVLKNTSKKWKSHCSGLGFFIRSHEGSRTFEEVRVKGISPLKFFEKVRQQSAQRMLARALMSKHLVPEYSCDFKDVEEYVAYIESHLGSPAMIVGFGPTAADKRIRL